MKSEIKRTQIKVGTRVRIVLKEDQVTGKLTEGTVGQILTRSSSHPHGIKVRLADGQVGRVKELLPLRTAENPRAPRPGAKPAP